MTDFAATIYSRESGSEIPNDLHRVENYVVKSMKIIANFINEIDLVFWCLL